MTPDDAAQRAATTRWSIMRAIKAHTLRATRDNRNRWSITPEDLAAWLAAHRQQSAPTERTVSAPRKAAQEAAQAQVVALRAQVDGLESALAVERARVEGMEREVLAERGRSEAQAQRADAAERSVERLTTILDRITAPPEPEPRLVPHRGVWARLLGIGA